MPPQETSELQPRREGGIGCSVWLDRHLYHEQDGIRIFCGDNREIAPMLGKYDLLLTDPPYGDVVSETYRANRISPNQRKQCLAVKTTMAKQKWDDAPPEPDVMRAMMAKAKWQILWGGNYYDAMPRSRCWFVWDKDNGDNWYADCELAWTNLDKAVRKFRYRWNGMLQENMAEKEIRYHPTQKPQPLMEWCIGHCPEAKTILDPWAGSGTTLIAARAKGLKADGIEINEQYCEAAKRRLSQGVLLAV